VRKIRAPNKTQIQLLALVFEMWRLRNCWDTTRSCRYHGSSTSGTTYLDHPLCVRPRPQRSSHTDSGRAAVCTTGTVYVPYAYGTCGKCHPLERPWRRICRHRFVAAPHCRTLEWSHFSWSTKQTPEQSAILGSARRNTQTPRASMYTSRAARPVSAATFEIYEDDEPAALNVSAFNTTNTQRSASSSQHHHHLHSSRSDAKSAVVAPSTLPASFSNSSHKSRAMAATSGRPRPALQSLASASSSSRKQSTKRSDKEDGSCTGMSRGVENVLPSQHVNNMAAGRAVLATAGASSSSTTF
jgi:hypothetical protein